MFSRTVQVGFGIRQPGNNQGASGGIFRGMHVPCRKLYPLWHSVHFGRCQIVDTARALARNFGRSLRRKRPARTPAERRASTTGCRAQRLASAGGDERSRDHERRGFRAKRLCRASRVVERSEAKPRERAAGGERRVRTVVVSFGQAFARTHRREFYAGCATERSEPAFFDPGRVRGQQPSMIGESCHALLERMSASWGQWRRFQPQFSFFFLSLTER
jgi:hypothetical protein